MNVFDKLKGCRQCRLHETRRNVVIGRGQIPADILFVGEAPGQVEDTLATPFVGPSGKLLNQMIQDGLGLYGEEVRYEYDFTRCTIHNRQCVICYYITNTVFCHPTDSFAGGNRAPHKDEMEACRRNFAIILSKVNPKIIVAVGKIAERYCQKLRKQYQIVPIVHPAFLLRQGGPASPYYLSTIRILSEVLQYAESTKEETSTN